ncbi:MAG: hypothetical protein IPP94_13120 [Ignavibacteria bacterium]|nr:hypothetical protein [Ignavibacteria bacterium]
MKRCLLFLVFLLNAGCTWAQEMRVHQIPVLGERVDFVEAMTTKNGVLHLVVRGVGPEWRKATGTGTWHHEYHYYIRRDASGFSVPVMLGDSMVTNETRSGEGGFNFARLVVTNAGRALVAWSFQDSLLGGGRRKRNTLSRPELRIARIEGDSLRMITNLSGYDICTLVSESDNRLHLLAKAVDTIVYMVLDGNATVLRRHSLGQTDRSCEFLFLELGTDGRAVAVFGGRMPATSLSVHLFLNDTLSEALTPSFADWVDDAVIDDMNRVHIAYTGSEKQLGICRVESESTFIDSTRYCHPYVVALDRDGGEFALRVAHWRDTTINGGPQWIWSANAEGKGRLFKNSKVIEAAANNFWSARTPAGRACVLVDTPSPEAFISAGEGRIIAFTLPKDNGATESRPVCLDENGTAWISTWGGTLYEIPFALKK